MGQSKTKLVSGSKIGLLESNFTKLLKDQAACDFSCLPEKLQAASINKVERIKIFFILPRYKMFLIYTFFMLA